jgi:hypothetical protein
MRRPSDAEIAENLTVATVVARNKNEEKSGVWNQAVGFVLLRSAERWFQKPWTCFYIYFIL